MSLENPQLPGDPMSGLVAKAVEYMVDAGQRSVLFFDIMRQRGDQYREHIAQTAPNVLSYAAELIIDGRKLDEPVNYALVRIIPPKGVQIDLERRPFIVVDPRAGHGPGIGGFKADSEIGVAMKAGHPCYFVGFLPEPMPGQTIERVARAEAIFIEKVIERHPEADGKPCVIGNCQAGWAIMILASLRPELFGPVIVAGAPLAYWAGVHGQYPMRSEYHDRPAGLAVAYHTRLSVGLGMPFDYLLDEDRLGARDSFYCLARHGFGQEPDEIARMTRLHGDADLAVGLEVADSRAMTGAGVDHDERPAFEVDLNSFGWNNAHQRVVDRLFQLPAIDDELCRIAQNMRGRLSDVLAVLIAALAHDVEEQHAPLPGVDHVLHGLGDQARHGSAR